MGGLNICIDGWSIRTNAIVWMLFQWSQAQPSFFLEFQIIVCLHKRRQAWSFDQVRVLARQIVALLLQTICPKSKGVKLSNSWSRSLDFFLGTIFNWAKAEKLPDKRSFSEAYSRSRVEVHQSGKTWRQSNNQRRSKDNNFV